MMVSTGELARACTLSDRGVQLAFDETNLPVFLVQAFQRAGAGQFEEAQALLTPAHLAQVEALTKTTQPGALQAQVVLGLVWQELKQWDRAIECLTAAVTAEPNAGYD